MPEIFKTPCTKTKALDEQLSLAKQSRLKVQAALAQQIFSEHSSLNLSSNSVMSIPNIFEDISQNIAKMDQNLYSTKANMEEILRTNSNDKELVSLS
jgi:hypothetical protein